MRKIILCIAVVAMASLFAHAQWDDPAKTGSTPERFSDLTTLAGQSGLAPTLDAVLVHQAHEARGKSATVLINAAGVELVDPATHTTPRLDEGHIIYKLDNGPEVKTTAKRLDFHDLSRGEHVITLVLASNDNHPLAPEKKLRVKIP